MSPRGARGSWWKTRLQVETDYNPDVVAIRVYCKAGQRGDSRRHFEDPDCEDATQYWVLREEKHDDNNAGKHEGPIGLNVGIDVQELEGMDTVAMADWTAGQASSGSCDALPVALKVEEAKEDLEQQGAKQVTKTEVDETLR